MYMYYYSDAGCKTVPRGVLLDVAVPCYKDNYLGRYFYISALLVNFTYIWSFVSS